MKKIIFSPVFLEHPVYSGFFLTSILLLLFIQESFLLTAILLAYLIYFSFIYGDRILKETHFVNVEGAKSESTVSVAEVAVNSVSKSEAVEIQREEAASEVHTIEVAEPVIETPSVSEDKAKPKATRSRKKA